MNQRAFDKRVYLASPTMHGDELKYMEEAYTTNWMSTIGRNIDVIEEELAQMLQQNNSVALCSGTSALHLALKAADIHEGDLVACSDLTFAASANPILYEKAIPVFIDSEQETWNMDPKALEKAFTLYPDIKAVVAVSLYGVPAKMDEIREICKEHNAVLIEDAAEALGSYYGGKPVGSFGDINCISFNGNKIITGSSGGMLLTHDPVIAAQVKKWSTQSRENAPWYQHEQIGYNYRMSNVIAGVVRGQLPYLNEHIQQKKEVFDRYKKGFADLPISMNYESDDQTSNYWLSCMIIDKEAMASQIRSDCQASFLREKGKTTPTEILQVISELNAEGRPLWKPMHLQPIFRNYPYIYLSESVSEDLFERGLCLPSDNKMTAEVQQVIIEEVRRCFSYE